MPCSDSSATPSSPSQLEWMIGLPWPNTRRAPPRHAHGPLLSAAPGSRDQVGHQEAPRVLPGPKSEGRNHIRRMWSCLLSMESQRARASQPRIPQEGGPGFMKPAYAGVGPAASSGVGQDFGSLALGCKAGGLAGAAWTGACARGVCALQGLDWAACARRPLGQKGSAGRPVACDSYSVPSLVGTL